MSKSSRIYILSELFYPNKTSTAYIMTEIAKYLSKKNQVKILSSDIKYDNNVDDIKDIEGLDIQRVKAFQGNKNNKIVRIIQSICTTVSLSIHFFGSVRKNDTVFAVTNPFLLIIFLGLIRKVKQFKYCLLVHDVFPENAVPANILKKDSLKYKILLKIYNWAYKKPDKLIVLGEDMNELVSKKINYSKPVVTIPNWFDYDLSAFSDFDRNVYTGIDLNNKIVIGFSGNIGRVQALMKFVDVFSSVNNKEIVLIIIGNGAQRESIENFVLEKKIKNIYFLGDKPRNEQQYFLNICDIGLVTLETGMFGLGVPSKTYNLMALGKPILYIGDYKSEIDSYIKNFNCGWSFSWDDKAKITYFLNSISPKNRNKYQALGNEAEKTAINNFTSDKILKQIEETITNENVN